MPLRKIADVQIDGETFTVYKGDFINICDNTGRVIYGLLSNESLVIDKYHVMQVVNDELAEDFIHGRERKRGYKSIRGF